MLQIAASPDNKGKSIIDCDQDVVERFSKAQLVFEETVQFPLCRENKEVENNNNNEATTMIRAVAPRLFNISLAHILIRKETHINEAMEILVEACLNKNSQKTTLAATESHQSSSCTKSVTGFVLDLKRRIQSHKQEWWMESRESEELKDLCGNVLRV